jgi:hypothetical protein
MPPETFTPPRVLYHGTSDGYLEGILARGLDPASSADGHLCYSDDPETARYHAGHMADWDSGSLGRHCRPILFTIPFDRFAADRFCLDTNFIRLGPSHGRAVGQDLQRRSWTWQTLLNAAGAVGYTGLLPVSRDDLTILEDACRS